MSVGCNTLLPPAGEAPTRTHPRDPPAALNGLVFRPKPARRGRALYPEPPRASSSLSDGMPQPSLAPAAACPTATPGATEGGGTVRSYMGRTRRRGQQFEPDGPLSGRQPRSGWRRAFLALPKNGAQAILPPLAVS